MFSGFKSGKKLTPKASRGNDGKSASREDVGPRSPDLQRSHDAPAPASPDSSVKYALKSKMTIFGGGGSHLKIHYVKGSVCVFFGSSVMKVELTSTAFFFGTSSHT